ncbi:hypothetical protein SELMODRAFT_416943 [Selaginella moellendorffii]|uniref:Uncharacterized protein n=1 Tax=Selaginella moellendorffii TaxID=88036 RepID=D8S0W0_SELML|nr:hypothetical protein SELMODRAFT_416943 [Selaginella moellendorffii]
MHKSYSQGDEAYGKKMEPVVHIKVYGLERNFCFLGGEAKRVLAQLSIVVPDTEVEAGKQSVEAKSWLHMLLPDTYKLPIPNVCDVKELGGHGKSCGASGNMCFSVGCWGVISTSSTRKHLCEVLAQMKDRARALDHNLLVSVSPGIWEVSFIVACSI